MKAHSSILNQTLLFSTLECALLDEASILCEAAPHVLISAAVLQMDANHFQVIPGPPEVNYKDSINAKIYTRPVLQLKENSNPEVFEW